MGLGAANSTSASSRIKRSFTSMAAAIGQGRCPRLAQSVSATSCRFSAAAGGTADAPCARSALQPLDRQNICHSAPNYLRFVAGAATQWRRLQRYFEALQYPLRYRRFAGFRELAMMLLHTIANALASSVNRATQRLASALLAKDL
jgi:hypothetical protein